MLVKKILTQPNVHYNMGKTRGHTDGGRYLKLLFPHLKVIGVYTPFNGKGHSELLERRREWDRRIQAELKREGGKEAVICLET